MVSSRSLGFTLDSRRAGIVPGGQRRQLLGFIKSADSDRWFDGLDEVMTIH